MIGTILVQDAVEVLASGLDSVWMEECDAGFQQNRMETSEPLLSFKVSPVSNQAHAEPRSPGDFTLLKIKQVFKFIILSAEHVCLMNEQR